MKPEVQCGLCILEWVYGRAIAPKGNQDMLPLFRAMAELIHREMKPSASVDRPMAVTGSAARAASRASRWSASTAWATRSALRLPAAGLSGW